jgi:cytochrome P450
MHGTAINTKKAVLVWLQIGPGEDAMTEMTLDDQLVDPEMYATSGVYDEIFRNLRRDDPVRWFEPKGFRPFWAVSKYNDVMEIERQSSLFSNWPRLNLVPIEEEEKIRAGSGKGSTNPLKMLVNMDEPDHRAHRAIAQAWFMPPNLKKLEDGLAKLAKEYIDRMVAFGGNCDFASDVATWYPMRVIMMITGVPPEDDEKMMAWSRAVTGSDDAEMSGDLKGWAARQGAIQEFFRYFAALSAERRKNPTDDLATVLAHATINGAPISELEALSYFVIIATAGHDTTSSTVSGGLLALINNPEQLAKLRANPDLLPSAIDEMLRWVSPVTHFFRTATQDYALRGKEIKAGQSLMMCYASANRDEDIFADPFAFKVDRSPNRHLAFGHGPHLCLGMHLAKMEIKALFRELLLRIDQIELSGEPSWVKASLLPGLKHLPIRYAMNGKA